MLELKLNNRPESMHQQDTTAQSAGAKPLDPETLDFLCQIFGLVREGNSERLAGLIERGMPVNFRNEKGDSLIMLASYHGHLETARLLLAAGADPNVANDQGQTPLAGVAYKGYLEIARLLLAHGAAVDGNSPDGKTPLMMAAMFNRVDLLQLLIDHGARVDAVDSRGMTAHSLAAKMHAQQTAAALAAHAQLPAGGYDLGGTIT